MTQWSQKIVCLKKDPNQAALVYTYFADIQGLVSLDKTHIITLVVKKLELEDAWSNFILDSTGDVENNPTIPVSILPHLLLCNYPKIKGEVNDGGLGMGQIVSNPDFCLKSRPFYSVPL